MKKEYETPRLKSGRNGFELEMPGTREKMLAKYASQKIHQTGEIWIGDAQWHGTEIDSLEGPLFHIEVGGYVYPIAVSNDSTQPFFNEPYVSGEPTRYSSELEEEFQKMKDNDVIYQAILNKKGASEELFSRGWTLMTQFEAQHPKPLERGFVENPTFHALIKKQLHTYMREDKMTNTARKELVRLHAHGDEHKEFILWNHLYHRDGVIDAPYIRDGIPFYQAGANATRTFFLGAKDGKMYEMVVDTTHEAGDLDSAEIREVTDRNNLYLGNR